jgi:uncharacterized protein YbbC (DUF1343 family)
MPCSAAAFFYFGLVTPRHWPAAPIGLSTITYPTKRLAKGQRVGVITFTNAASDEIKSRLAFDPLIDVSTIHSFAWSLTSH